MIYQQYWVVLGLSTGRGRGLLAYEPMSSRNPSPADRPGRRLRWILAVLLAFLLGGGAAVSQIDWQEGIDSFFGAEQQPPGEYGQMLADLDVRPPAPMTDYDRSLFGPAWSDDVRVEGGNNGCDTRNDILRRDLDDLQVRPGTRDCLIERGVFTGPYSGEEIEFIRGNGDVHIDHVVALGDAWAKGAQQLDGDTRRDLANDPRNLLAVDGSLNMQKGAADAASWLPPNEEFRCEYARMQVEVKWVYDLWVTPDEHESLARELAACP